MGLLCKGLMQQQILCYITMLQSPFPRMMAHTNIYNLRADIDSVKNKAKTFFPKAFHSSLRVLFSFPSFSCGC